jgi:DNA-binding LytR/AlgR family response regulator
MKIAICDDDIKQLDLIKMAVENYIKEHGEQNFDIECFDDPCVFLQQYEKSGGYDIVLLDICMPDILGTEVARKIRKRQDKSEIIFLTTSSDYAVEAFALKAAHYIIKPFTTEQFFEAMDRAAQKFKNRQIKKISLKLRNGEVRIVELDEIMYVESYLHSQNVCLKNGECIETRQTMAGLSCLFDEAAKGQIISPYKGFLVNQKSIRNIASNKIILKNGKEIPVVKRNLSAIKEAYFNFAFQQ